MSRRAEFKRRTRETDISVVLDLDGTGQVKASTGIGFFDHMLDSLGKMALFDLAVDATGDLEVDAHHTVEDVGLCLGACLREAVGSREGLARYGWAILPMDESLVMACVDLSGRPLLVYHAPRFGPPVGGFDPALAKEFLRAFATQAGMTLHVRVLESGNSHHVLESMFKALGKALRDAVAVDNRVQGALSTKGIL